MKAYSISLFLFILNIAFSLIVNLQIFTMMAPVPGDPILLGYDQGVIDTAQSYSNSTVSGLDTIDMVGMLLSFVSAVLNATFLLPFFLSELGVPTFLHVFIVAPVWYCYLAAIVQLTTGRILPLFE